MSPGPEFDHGLNARWREAVDAHKAHAAAGWPAETVGVVDRDGRYVALPNVADNPLVSFAVPEGVIEEHGPLAVLHSHCSVLDPDGSQHAPQDCPSAADMQSQMDSGIPWGITLVTKEGAIDPFWFGDCLPRMPLIQRRFKEGVQDCYDLIRDWHAEEAKIEIPNFPRDPNWWERGEELYAKFEEAGFVRQDRGRNLVVGDVFLCKIRSNVMNHGGIYVGNGLILHHLAHKLSGRDPASVWAPKLNFIVRHRDLPDSWRPDAP